MSWECLVRSLYSTIVDLVPVWQWQVHSLYELVELNMVDFDFEDSSIFSKRAGLMTTILPRSLSIIWGQYRLKLSAKWTGFVAVHGNLTRYALSVYDTCRYALCQLTAVTAI